jgi:hypothetical protein
MEENQNQTHQPNKASHTIARNAPQSLASAKHLATNQTKSHLPIAIPTTSNSPTENDPSHDTSSILHLNLERGPNKVEAQDSSRNKTPPAKEHSANQYRQSYKIPFIIVSPTTAPVKHKLLRCGH